MIDEINGTAGQDSKKDQELLQAAAGHLSSVEQRDLSAIQVVLRSTAFWILVILVILVVLFGYLTPNKVFLKPETLFTIGLNASQMLILAVGATVQLASKNMDLSVGTNLILTSTLAAKVLKMVAGSPAEIMSGSYPNLGWAIAAAVLASILFGGLFGMLNGIIVTKLKMEAFIATLATMMVYWGISLVITQGASEVGIPRALQLGFGHKKLFDLIPMPLLVALVISALMWLMMRYTKFGLYTCAIGSSKESSERSGINTDGYVISIFILVGILAGIAGFFDLARFATTNPQGHQTDGLMAITAAVMGGTSLKGGRASIPGAMLGALIPTIIQTGLVIMGVGAFYQMIATGVFLVIAVYLDQRRYAGYLN
ncbi:MAG: ribose transport system permease protein [Chloroflexota bacterium]|nr:ribose transport system permease protein [Chloroflexota bacterium]